jgi:predicted RNA-binding Zn-ribbon protein involved in translation (DUF1610 family)
MTSENCHYSFVELTQVKNRFRSKGSEAADEKVLETDSLRKLPPSEAADSEFKKLMECPECGFPRSDRHFSRRKANSGYLCNICGHFEESEERFAPIPPREPGSRVIRRKKKPAKS